MSMDLENLISCFQETQIPFDVIEDVSLQSAFETTTEDGEKKSFPLLVFPFEDMFGDIFYRFVITPFVKRPDEARLCEWYTVISHINHNIPILKFVVDDDGDLGLVLDILVDSMDINRFNAALQSIADYAGLYYPLLTDLSREGLTGIEDSKE